MPLPFDSQLAQLRSEMIDLRIRGRNAEVLAQRHQMCVLALTVFASDHYSDIGRALRRRQRFRRTRMDLVGEFQTLRMIRRKLLRQRHR